MIAQAAKEIERVRRERDIYEHAVHAVIGAGRHRRSREPAGSASLVRAEDMRGIWIGLALSLPIWGLIIWWLLS